MSIFYEYPEYQDYLCHHGVKGMKWGVRRSSKLPTSDIRSRVDSAKANYKSAKKAHNKAYKDAYNYSSAHVIRRFTNKKVKAESDKRWDNAKDKADATNKAKDAYKQAKQERKKALETAWKDVKKNASFGDKMVYNDSTRKKAAKYIVDNNMSVSEANARAKKEARRNTVAIVAAIGAVNVATLYMKR